MEAAQSTDPFMSYWQLKKKGMVFKPESKVICIVHHPDLPKLTLNLNPESQLHTLFEEIASKYEHDVDSFDLILQKNNTILNDKMSGSLEELGFEVDPDARNSVLLTMRKSCSSRTASASAAASDCHIAPPPLPPPIIHSQQPPPPPHFTYNSIIKHDTGQSIAYVGLVNQAMTCYLNSLIQALYMTPEFRNALYTWKHDPKDKSAAIQLPVELQKLFLNLQTSKRNAVETTELTRSFGWETSDVWQQHDIQELCRVMFDALEQVLKNTEHADLINRLYQGKMIDYVKCLECGREKTRDDTFLDIPLPLRPFGSTVAYGSVEEAMRAFVQPETLDGNNQYHCESCQKKCDAHKGLKFSKFPYLLTLHLKRFDFDYTTMHRIKLNDKVIFPDTLDLNSFIAAEKEKEREREKEGEEGLGDEEVGGAGGRNDDSSTTDSGEALDDEMGGSAQGALANAADNEDDEGIDVSGGQNENNEKNTRHHGGGGGGGKGGGGGPYIYELFSIMIHSGSASGGHYYAYIKDFANGLWFCFNDQNVTRITQEDITKTYGGGFQRQYYSATYSSSTNAYMLMYRQIDKDRNCDAIAVDNFPPHIKQLYREMQEKEENDRKLKEKESEVCRLKIHCLHPESKKDARIHVRHDRPLEEVTELAWKQMGLENVVPLEQCRLVTYDPIQEVIEESYEGHESDTISSILAQRKHINRPDFLLEVRRENANFQHYQLGDVSLQAQVVHLDTEEIDSAIMVRGDSLKTIGELKESVVRILHLTSPASQITIAMETGHCHGSCFKSIKDTDSKCSTLSQYTSQIMYVCDGHCDEDPEKQFSQSKMHKIIQQYINSIFIHVSLPDTDPETLERLAIPPLNSVGHDSRSSSTEKLNEISENDKVNNVSESGSSPRGGLSLPLASAASNYTSGTGMGAAVDMEEAAAGGGDQSTSEDSSLTDSDRTLIGDDKEEYPMYNPNDLSTDKLIQLGGNDSEDYKISTPYHESTTNSKEDGDKWFEADMENASANGEESKSTGSQYNYFRATPYSKVLKPNQKLLKVHVDKRMTVGKLKQCLESYVGVAAKYFKMTVSSGGAGGSQDVECSRLTDTLATFKDLDKVDIKLERVLRGGEHTVKLFHLVLDSSQPFKFLCDWVIVKGQTVGKTKQDILNELSRNKKFNMKIPYNKCRLRKKNWRNPTKACLDEQVWEEDVMLTSNPELLIQELPETEIVTSPSQLLVFLRRWYPSKLQLASLQEIAVEREDSLQGLKSKISEVSGIAVEFVEVCKSTVGFPSDVSVLTVQDMEWNRQADTCEGWPLSIDDGSVLFYRDNREQLKTLTNEERKELTNKENARLGSTCHFSSPRKERPLKIYFDGSRSANSNPTTSSSSSTSNADCSV
ncbi:ubiquitin carboxyl-terminal hydrolase 47 isoform X2 [Nilaparvata lugens]|uniref:ubiquitin carboxyl-terminal hydrolase 47 isoform X2 n=1 Tax=Nilaparvata lugens TaxID=108931 RepID=UPI00193DC1E4|nr:ubiquitin carboxyl-terminal hydrolase 47 isoform X2 [Nilaparvata lugens]